MKDCSICNQTKELSCFQENRKVCKDCRRTQKQQWRHANPDAVKSSRDSWKQENLDKVREIKRLWAQENPEYQLHYNRAARKANPQRFRAQVAVRRKRVQQATPPWANMKELKSFYEDCPQGYHVDHIIPLNGELVSGLNVIGNLQYLPALDNLRKGNRYENNG